MTVATGDRRRGRTPSPAAGAAEPPPSPGRVEPASRPGRPGLRRSRRGLRRPVAALARCSVALVAGVSLGPVSLPPGSVAAELLNLLPGVHLDSGLTEREIAIVTELRLPRVVLGLLVGGLLALAGGCYQGVFRNPLADPYLLGVAAGAGLARHRGDRPRRRRPAGRDSGLPIDHPAGRVRRFAASRSR